MKFIFPIATLITCLVAAYFTLSQKEKFTDVQTVRTETISKNIVVSRSADKAEEEVDALEVVRETSKDNFAVATQSVLALVSAQAPLKREMAKLEDEIAKQRVELDTLEAEFEKIQAIARDLGSDVTLDNLKEKITEIEELVETKTNKAAELATLVDGAQGTLAQRQTTVRRLVKRKSDRSKRIAQNAQEARISAVNSDWGFVVIAAGSNSGFSPQTALIVKRNGRMIGRVNPSSIEPTQTIAEMDLKSMAPGVRFQPGDRVLMLKPAVN